MMAVGMGKADGALECHHLELEVWIRKSHSRDVREGAGDLEKFWRALR